MSATIHTGRAPVVPEPADLPATPARPGAHLGRWAVSQFRRPSGFWGHVAGRIMATRPSNLERSRWTMDLLDVRPTDWVLEVGYGPGVALGWLAERAHAGLVVGIDHSDVMLRMAARRNRVALAQGRMSLMLGDVETLPDFGVGFDRIMLVNVARFWKKPVPVLRDLRERLRPGGRIAVTSQPRNRGATDADTLRMAGALEDNLHRAGFHEVRVELKPMRPVAAACVLGER